MRGTLLSLATSGCDGQGLCAERLPEGITFDDWAVQILKTSDVPAGLAEDTQHAVDACPVLALRQARSRN